MASLLLVPCLPICAQNSGGGWVAQTTNQLGPFPYNQTPYDWTGFTISGTTISSNGTSNSGSYIYFATFAGHGVLVGSSIGNRSSTTASSGASTYEWLWTPTGSNVGAPPPPLYVLAKGSADADLSYSGSANGLSGSGTLTYGPTVSDYFSGTASATQVTLYELPLASGSPNVSVSIGPVIKHSYSGTPTGSEGVITEVLQTSGRPIVLANPNPMNRPDLGDGTNQYVYDATAPSATAPYGFLNFPGTVSVVGSVAADTGWILRGDPNGSKVGLTVNLPAETIAQGFQLYDTSNLPSVPVSSLVEKYGPSATLGDGFLYAGLPKLNTGLGNHLVTLTVSGNASQQAHIQTFFTGVDSKGNMVANYPNAAKNLGFNNAVIPNWYYYYNQVYASTGNYDAQSGSSYTDAQSPATYPIHIANDAYEASSIRIFDINPVSPKYIRYVGDMDISGVHRYIYVCAHEDGHQTLLVQGGVYNFSANPANSSPVSADGDNVSDAWEAVHHLNPNVSDTTGAYGAQSNGDVGDNEVLADIPALPVIFQQVNTWKQDWANGGLQTGSNTYTTGKPAGFYWTFHALVNGTTWQAGNSYSVYSLKDLQNQYPTLLTSLP